ncbi:type 4a pilus biogenesis protein PilO [Elusimicrobiota bacterium]
MTKKVQQILIVMVLLFGGVIYALYNYLLLPINNKYDQAIKNLYQVENKLNQMKSKSLELPKLKAELEFLQKEVSQLAKLLPENKQIPGLLRTVTIKSKKYGLKVNNFSPNTMESKGNYVEIPFQISLSGRYHPFARFLADIGQESRLISMKDISFSMKKGTKEDPTTLNASFSLIAYSYKQ